LHPVVIAKSTISTTIKVHHAPKYHHNSDNTYGYKLHRLDALLWLCIDWRWVDCWWMNLTSRHSLATIAAKVDFIANCHPTIRTKHISTPLNTLFMPTMYIGQFLYIADYTT